MALFVVSALLGGLELYYHHIQYADERNEHDKAALDYLGYLIHCYTGRIVVPGIISGLILLLFDRHGGTSFYLSDIFIAATQKALPE